MEEIVCKMCKGKCASNGHVNLIRLCNYCTVRNLENLSIMADCYGKTFADAAVRIQYLESRYIESLKRIETLSDETKIKLNALEKEKQLAAVSYSRTIREHKSVADARKADLDALMDIIANDLSNTARDQILSKIIL